MHAAFASFVGKPQAEFVGETSVTLGIGTEEETAVFGEAERKVIETGQRIDQPELTITYPGGEKIVQRVIRLPLFDDDGNVEGIVAVCEDITKQKSLEDQLRQAQKMEAVGVLAGGVAHDFNNMLQIIHGYANRVLSRTDSNPVKGDVQKILKASESAADLTKQLLAFSRKQPLQATNVAIDALIVNLMRMMARLRCSIRTDC